MLGVIVVSDRGDRYLPSCLDNIAKRVRPMLPLHIVDDRDHQLGMAGAVQAGFAYALDAGWKYVIWVEEDFRFNGDMPLGEMMVILEQRPHLAQMVLKRQAWSVEERCAGGLMELHPDDYAQRELETPGGVRYYVEHYRIFSLNPCLIPCRVLQLGWPEGNEAGFTERCLDEGYSFAFFGKKCHPPLVTHVGDVRAEGWRL